MVGAADLSAVPEGPHASEVGGSGEEAGEGGSAWGERASGGYDLGVGENSPKSGVRGNLARGSSFFPSTSRQIEK